MNNSKIYSQHGMAALLTVIIIATATLIMAFNASLLGLGELNLGYISQQGNEVTTITESCIEEALYRLKLDPAYSGGTLALGNGSCIINITANGDNRIIIASGTMDVYNKKIQVGLTLTNHQINITSWQIISD